MKASKLTSVVSTNAARLMSWEDIDDFGENQQGTDSNQCSQDNSAEINGGLSVSSANAAVGSVAGLNCF